MMISHQIMWVSPLLAAPLESLIYRRNEAASVFSIDITLVDARQHWMNWFHLLLLVWQIYSLL